jgi:threonine/homoserine/homoserine lactone efflux protein
VNEALHQSRRNQRTGVVLAAVALVFFIAVFVTHMIVGRAATAYIGAAVLLFLGIAIGRALIARKADERRSAR